MGDNNNNNNDNNILIKKITTNQEINVNVKKITPSSATTSNNRKNKKNNRKHGKRRKDTNTNNKKKINYERISLQEMIALRNRSIVSSMVANETKKISINEEGKEEEKMNDEYNMYYNKREIDKKFDYFLSPQQKKRLSVISYNIGSFISNTNDDDNDKTIDLSQGTINFSALGMDFSAFDINDKEGYFNPNNEQQQRATTNSGRRRKSSALIIKRDGSMLMKWHKDNDEDYDSDIDLEEGCIVVDLNDNYDDYSDLDDDDY